MTFSERYSTAAKAQNIRSVAEDMCEIAAHVGDQVFYYVDGATTAIMEAVDAGQLSIPAAATRLCAVWHSQKFDTLTNNLTFPEFKLP